MKAIKYLFIFFFLVAASQSKASCLPDSIAMKDMGGRRFLVYKVGPKETWYGIAKKYLITPEELHKENTDVGENLEIDQILFVPFEVMQAKLDEQARKDALAKAEADKARQRFVADSTSKAVAEQARQKAAAEQARQKFVADSTAKADAEVARLKAEAERARQKAIADAAAKAEAEAKAREQARRDSIAKAQAEAERARQKFVADSTARADALAKARRDSIAREVAARVRQKAISDSLEMVRVKEQRRQDSLLRVEQLKAAKKAYADSLARIREQVRQDSLARVERLRAEKKSFADSLARIKADADAKEKARLDAIAKVEAQKARDKFVADSITKAAADARIRANLEAKAQVREELRRDSIAKAQKEHPANSPSLDIKKPVDINTNNDAMYYDVLPGESLYSIAKKYDTSPDSIRKWNRLSSNEVKTDQSLIVGFRSTVMNNIKPSKPGVFAEPPPKTDDRTVLVKTGRTTAEPPANKKPETTQPIFSNEPAPAKPAAGTILIKTASEINAPDEVVKNSIASRGKRQVTEQGVASWIAGDEIGSNKYFALHRLAPIGTIIKITNKMNGQYVFVKVIGSLPDTGDNSDLIIKISKPSADKIGVLDQRFQCSLEYTVAD